MSKNVEPESQVDSSAGELTSRRELMKKAAVGATAAGIIWSAPKVEGFSLRPNYAAAGSNVGAGGVTLAFAAARFNFGPAQDLINWAGTAQLGSTVNGVPANLSVRGVARRNLTDTRITLSEFNWNGAGTAFINAMDAGPNVGNPTPSINGATPLPVGNASHFDAIANTENSVQHRLTTTFTCS